MRWDAVPKRQDIIDFARSLVGTRFKHQGRLPGAGLDCIGVVAVTAQHFGLTYHDMTGYSNRPDGVTLLREFDKALVRIGPADVQCGDVLTFWCEAPGKVQHAAIATDRGMIHSTVEYRRVVEHRLDDYWRKRLAVCYRFPGDLDTMRFSWR
jgi:cell wall-associated NlpC family hydrolase